MDNTVRQSQKLIINQQIMALLQLLQASGSESVDDRFCGCERRLWKLGPRVLGKTSAGAMAPGKAFGRKTADQDNRLF